MQEINLLATFGIQEQAHLLITASTIGQYYASMTDVNGCSGYTDTVDVTNMSVTLSTTGYSLCNPQCISCIKCRSRLLYLQLE